MTSDELNKLKKEMQNIISLDRVFLVSFFPFTGGMVMRFNVVPVRDKRCSTACTDGNNIFVDIDFYSSLNENERRFILAHEVWHNIYLHFLRRCNRERTIWNIATDCEVNYMLSQEGLIPPKNILMPDVDDRGKNAEEIYEKLINELDQDKGKSKNKSQSGSNNNKQNNSNRLSGQFDKHIEKYDNEYECEENSVFDKWGEKGDDPDFTPNISEDTSEKIREIIISEAQKYERQKGTLPNHLSQIVSELRNPEIDWKTRLSQFITRCIGSKSVWVPPSRRYVYQGIYLQSRRGEKIRITCIVDTSGSTCNDLPKFMAELTSLASTFGNYELTLLQCDSEVKSVEIYNETNPFPVEDCKNIKWVGMGGSDLNPAFDEILKRDIESSVCIVITDGFIDFPTRNPLSIPTLIVLTKDGNENCCDWGEKIKFKGY